MSQDNIVFFIAAIVFVFVIELAFRKNKKVYSKAEEAQSVMLNRQSESLATLKEMNATLKEISKKLDK